MTQTETERKWSVEVEYSESDIDEAIRLSWGIATPNERAELNTTYSFFASEPEAAHRFLEEVRMYPSARALAEDIELAKKAVNQRATRLRGTAPESE